jgi:carboxypeptidase C (cathepsin A)
MKPKTSRPAHSANSTSSSSNGHGNGSDEVALKAQDLDILRVLVANGYYDLATPYFATEYTFNHLALDPTLQRNIIMTYYEAGHMMYLHEPSLHQLSEDLHAFITNDTDDIAANRPEG